MNWLENRTDDDKVKQNEVLAIGNLPKHVAIIMDGNGRWAQQRTMPRLSGHKQGVETVRDIVKASSQLGVKYLTLYAFSMENWKRPQKEVSGLMKLLEFYLKNEVEELHANNVRIRSIGKLNALPKPVHKILQKAIDHTEKNDGLTLTLALSYSSRWDIVRATQMISLDVRRGKLSPEDITEETFTDYLLTKDMPDPDLLIRTSGEMRISNFLLWELAYSEIYVTKKCWPDFERNDLYEAISCFAKRERRFGLTSAQLIDQSNSSSYLQRVVNAITNR
ncbi:MAG: isoprenyl transferase [Bacteriodetes bacterium]|nr:isoprenyl transferase [Bacteroidota bacterium]